MDGGATKSLFIRMFLAISERGASWCEICKMQKSVIWIAIGRSMFATKEKYNLQSQRLDCVD